MTPAQLPPDRSMRELIEEYVADDGALNRVFSLTVSPARRARLEKLQRDWLTRLESVSFETLPEDGKMDFLLFRRHLSHVLSESAASAKRDEEWLPLAPFAEAIVELDNQRIRMEDVDGRKSAETLNRVWQSVAQATHAIESAPLDSPVAEQAADAVDSLRKALSLWHGFFNGYDPTFTWWTATPFKAAKRALKDYSALLRKSSGSGEGLGVVGRPVGRIALEDQLKYELIPYSPEELIELAEREFHWCEVELARASAELGFGDDWKRAQEHVKGMHPEPGGQPAAVRKLALEGIEFIESRDLLTVPDMAKETWRMDMMSPEKQRVNPFFLGGEKIVVSYPTDTMSHEEKMMSMRGNNTPFSHATVQHELIPGHHMQQFMGKRYRPYRRLFSTPFWIEGWTLYWELRLWDLGFPRTPEERIGMLFWRMHRCARIVFSLKFHLGQMSAQECVEMLVDRVGHERANAEGEIRRSFAGNYPPLYQAAYMIGGLQVRALYREIVGSGRMAERAFHDEFMKQNEMPIAALRAVLLGQELTPDTDLSWRFADLS